MEPASPFARMIPDLEPDQVSAPCRILLVATYAKALSSFVAPFARFLEARGHRVTLAASDEALAGPSTFPALLAAGFDARVVSFTNRPAPHRDFQAALSLARLLRRESFDVVHTFTAKAGVIGRVVSRLCGVPVVVHTAFSFPHLDTPKMAWLYMPMELLATAACDHVFCISSVGAEQARRLPFIPRRGISNPGIGLDLGAYASLVDQEKARLDLSLPVVCPLIGTAARLISHKRIDVFLAACREVASQLPSARFVVLGDGPLRGDLASMAHSLGLSALVHFIPYLTDPRDVVNYYRALDLFVLPTEREGFGMVFAEAMAARIPVVGPKISPVDHIVVDGETGLLVVGWNPAHYAAAMLDVLSNPRLAADFGVRGRERVFAHFNQETGYRQIAATYQVLRASKAKAIGTSRRSGKGNDLGN